jgi:hypothetical protein
VPHVQNEANERSWRLREKKERRQRADRARMRLADAGRWRELEASGEYTWPETNLNDDHWAVVRRHGVS